MLKVDAAAEVQLAAC